MATTFGIELEFLICFRDFGRHSGVSPSGYCTRADDNTLRLWNIEDTDSFICELVRDSLRKSQINVADDDNLQYDKWEVKRDDTLYGMDDPDDPGDPEFSDSPKISFVDVEITSPVFEAGDGRAEDEIRQVINTINEEFRVQLNATCGLHVHVGAGRERVIPLRDLRRLGMLLWTAEPLLTLSNHHNPALHSSCSSYLCIP